MLLPVDNHSCDLLIHEQQDGDQQGGKSRGQVNPPGVSSEGGHKPAPLGTRWLGWRETEASVSCTLTRSQRGKSHLEFTWHDEFRSFHSHQNIDSTEDEYGQDDGKVADELPHLGGGEQTRVS